MEELLTPILGETENKLMLLTLVGIAMRAMKMKCIVRTRATDTICALMVRYVCLSTDRDLVFVICESSTSINDALSVPFKNKPTMCLIFNLEIL